MHHAVAAEAVGAEEAGHVFDRAKDAVVVGRHFVESRPRALGIDGDVFEAGHTVGGALQNFLDECRLEVGLVAGSFFGIVPRQQEAEAFGTEVKSVGHVDDHGDFVGDAVEGFGGDELAAQRFDRQIDACQRGDLRGPCAGSVDDDASADGAASGIESTDAVFVAMDGRDFGRAPNLCAALDSAGGEAGHHAVGIDEAVGGAEGAAENVVGAKLWDTRDNVVAADHAGLRQSELMLQRLIGAQVVEVLLRRRDEHVALRAIASGLAESFVELRVEGNRIQRHLDVGCGGELGAHAAHGFAGGAFALVGFAFDDENVAGTGLGEMPGDAGADDASANDDDVCGFHDGGHCNWRWRARGVTVLSRPSAQKKGARTGHPASTTDLGNGREAVALGREPFMNTFSVVQIMTASIAPVIVISGVGLLLLSISNRYGRAIDRVRLLAREMVESDPESARRRHLAEQLRLTDDRAHILKRSMLYASVCIFFVSLTILSLFAEH